MLLLICQVQTCTWRYCTARTATWSCAQNARATCMRTKRFPSIRWSSWPGRRWWPAHPRAKSISGGRKSSFARTAGYACFGPILVQVSNFVKVCDPVVLRVKVAICEGCRISTHSTHSFAFIADLAADERRRLTAATKQCNELVPKVKHRLDQLKLGE